MIILFDNAVRIPAAAVEDFDAFRRWTRSNSFPERGEYAFLGQDLWAGVTMETVIHNQLKSLFAIVIGGLVMSEALGRFFSDRMRLVHEGVSLSTEPDAMFASHAAVRSGQVRWDRGRESMELIGAPDMVLEIVSTSSLSKDTILLRELYAAAGISEYWLVNPLHGQLAFDILRLSRGRYVATRKSASWVKSVVFGKSFQITTETSTDDLPQYLLHVR